MEHIAPNPAIEAAAHTATAQTISTDMSRPFTSLFEALASRELNAADVAAISRLAGSTLEGLFLQMQSLNNVFACAIHEKCIDEKDVMDVGWLSKWIWNLVEGLNYLQTDPEDALRHRIGQGGEIPPIR